MKKKLIRLNVWETNSSSTHSVSIADSSKEFVLETIYPDQDGKISLIGGEFGWEWQKYNDALTKANYCAVDCMNDKERQKMLIDVIKKQTKADLVDILAQGEYDKPNHSYIDHDSHGVAGEAFKTKESLNNFIFNKNSWLFTGNDNSTAEPTFYHVPEFKGGRQIVPKYKYELKIEGYKSTKFIKKPTNEEIENALHSLLQGVYLNEGGHFDDDHSILAQMNRNSYKKFEFSSWRKPINFKKKEAYFLRENASHDECFKKWRDENPNADWVKGNGYAAVKKLEDELLAQKDCPYVKAVKYSIISLK